MKEKELRLALVCSGGISLAVYMHGVTKEILKLARASAAFHSVRDTHTRQTVGFADLVPPIPKEHDTEAVYFDALKSLGEALDLRIIVDTIAGASAGGINGIILARALAHDLPIGGLTEVWLKEADALELLDKDARARTFSKWYLKPLLWAYGKIAGAEIAAEREMREKLSVFFRSRWFKPPFSGLHLTSVLFDGIYGMGQPRTPTASLLPNGHRLELFVTLTDFYGYPHNVPIHDPANITEKEHRHYLCFSYLRESDGTAQSDFTTDNVPALAFAARATSSIPGAFPPAQLLEIDLLLKEHGLSWQSQAHFMEVNFHRYMQAGADPLKTSFVDGSVLNDKPFHQAIEAIKNRPAYRAVDRRVVYIDPFPDSPPPPPDGRLPGFFVTLKSALADIPRSQPIFDELSEIVATNAEVRQIKNVVDSLRPQVRALVEEIAGEQLKFGTQLKELRNWREQANARAAKEAGFAYGGYLRLKIDSVLRFVAGRVNDLCDIEPGSAASRAILDILTGWAVTEEILPEASGQPLTRKTVSRARSVPALVEFLLSFDVAFRRRRLRFVVRILNQLYGNLANPGFAGITAKLLDLYKKRIYDLLSQLRHYETSAFAEDALHKKANAIFGDLRDGKAKSAPSAETIDELMESFGSAIDLRQIDDETDRLFTTEGMGLLAQSEAASELITAYIGFAFWDVLTFSLTRSRDLDEYDEVRVVRISPNDAKAIRAGGASATLKGIYFNRFGAFFSRAYRENDYLWGRLHGVDRLIDMLVDVARSEGNENLIDVSALKKRAFQIILDKERPVLGQSAQLLKKLEEEIAAL